MFSVSFVRKEIPVNQQFVKISNQLVTFKVYNHMPLYTKLLPCDWLIGYL